MTVTSRVLLSLYDLCSAPSPCFLPNNRFHNYLQVVIIRARNTLWFDDPQWDLPVARTLPWSGPGQTLCDTACHFEVRLTVAVHGRAEVLRNPGVFRVRVRSDLDAGMEESAMKRLIGFDLAEPAESSSANMSNTGYLDTVVTIRPNKLIDSSNRLTLLTLRLEPVLDRVVHLLWKPIRINASISPVDNPATKVRDSIIEPIPSVVVRRATEIVCPLGDPLQYTGSKLIPFVFQLNTAGAFKPLDLPMNDAPQNGVLALNKTDNLTWSQKSTARRKSRHSRQTGLDPVGSVANSFVNDTVTIYADGSL
ncbi:Integrin alpha-5 [Fasciola gigantica]|uniref:Integrin alpha-5 n=1 Tax=Fasciola gigantica TaxID=46835 RepID=A0A504YR76_FASGI|nr:Integrin alpha-5 [Fasciola gigantica]